MRRLGILWRGGVIGVMMLAAGCTTAGEPPVAAVRTAAPAAVPAAAPAIAPAAVAGGRVPGPAVAAPEVAPAAAPAAADAAKKGRPTRLLGFDSVKSERTTITAERMEFDYKEMVAVFDENVRVENTQFLMMADRALVFLEGTNEVKQLLAMGHVSLTNENRSAACDRAVYTRATEQIVLTGNAQLSRDGDFIKGDRIAIWLDDERMEVSPGTFVISPETLKSSDRGGGLPRKQPDAGGAGGHKRESRQEQ